MIIWWWWWWQWSDGDVSGGPLQKVNLGSLSFVKFLVEVLFFAQNKTNICSGWSFEWKKKKKKKRLSIRCLFFSASINRESRFLSFFHSFPLMSYGTGQLMPVCTSVLHTHTLSLVFDFYTASLLLVHFSVPAIVEVAVKLIQYRLFIW